MPERIDLIRRRHPLSRLGTLLRSSSRKKALVVEAALSLAIARLQLAVFSFSRLSKSLGHLVSPDEDFASHESDTIRSADVELARDVGWAVKAVAPLLPFRAVCLQQALAAHAMLRRRRIPATLHLGAGKGDHAPLAGHVWLDAAGVKVTGYPVAPTFTEVGRIVPRGR